MLGIRQRNAWSGSATVIGTAKADPTHTSDHRARPSTSSLLIEVAKGRPGSKSPPRSTAVSGRPRTSTVCWCAATRSADLSTPVVVDRRRVDGVESMAMLVQCQVIGDHKPPEPEQRPYPTHPTRRSKGLAALSDRVAVAAQLAGPTLHGVPGYTEVVGHRGDAACLAVRGHDLLHRGHPAVGPGTSARGLGTLRGFGRAAGSRGPLARGTGGRRAGGR